MGNTESGQPDHALAMRGKSVAAVKLGGFHDQQHRRAKHHGEEGAKLAVDEQEVERPCRQIERAVDAEREGIELRR